MTRTAAPPPVRPRPRTAASDAGSGSAPSDRRGRLLAPYRDLPPWVAVTQLFFGLGWLRAAGAKVIDTGWWTGDGIQAFVADHQTATLPWIEPLLGVVLANAALVAVGVVVAQLLIGVALVANRSVLPALAVGGLLNLTFLAVGAVNPSAFYLVGQGAVVLWIVGRRQPSAGLSIGLQLATAVTIALAVISAPFITTIHPAEVIDDPGVMVVLLAGLTAVAAELTHRTLFRRGLP